MIAMERPKMTIRNMLAAVEAPLYDIGVLTDRGMLPGLDGIPAAAVLERLRLLKHRYARGAHVYIRLAGEHRLTVLDDLNQTTLAPGKLEERTKANTKPAPNGIAPSGADSP